MDEESIRRLVNEAVEQRMGRLEAAVQARLDALKAALESHTAGLEDVLNRASCERPAESQSFTQLNLAASNSGFALPASRLRPDHNESGSPRGPKSPTVMKFREAVQKLTADRQEADREEAAKAEQRGRAPRSPLGFLAASPSFSAVPSEGALAPDVTLTTTSALSPQAQHKPPKPPASSAERVYTAKSATPPTTPRANSLQRGPAAHRRKSDGAFSLLDTSKPQIAIVSPKQSPADEALVAFAPSPSGVSGSRLGDPQESSQLRREASRRERRKSTYEAVAKQRDAQSEQSRGYSETNWLMTVADITFVTMAVLSIMIALMQVHPRGNEFREGGMFHVSIVAYNAAVEAFTVGWVVSRFFLAKRKGDWEVVDDLAMIRARYMRSWFAYDLLYAVPIDFIFVGWQWEVYRWLQLRHFLRLLRIFNLGSSHNPLLSSRLWFQFMSFCFAMLLTAHVLGSFFWLFEDRYTYEESLYWAIATMTSIGYGDIVPTSMFSRVYVCFAMFFGIMMLSTMTAFATSFLTDKDRLTQEEESKKQMLYAMMEHYDVPWDVQKEVIAAAPSMLEKDNEQTFKELSAKLPPFISAKLDSYIRVKMLRVVPLFKDITSIDALLDLGSRLAPHFYPALAPIIEQGDTDRDMYFLIRGIVEVIVATPLEDDPDSFDAKVVTVLEPGAVFGERNLLHGGERTATIRAITLCEVLALSQPDFEEFLDAHAGVRERITGELKRKVERAEAQNAKLQQSVASPGQGRSPGVSAAE